ncbi:MAG: hypothetical protein MJ168_08600 [Clostridia bacterium]|nr:hypothetical protein [Clostridia bacterium]
MPKTLKTIQKISSIARILSKVFFALFTVSSILCLAAYISVIIGFDSVVAHFGDVNIHGFIDNAENLSKGALMAKLSAGFIITAADAILCRLSQKYFENELIVGTPFTFEGANEMKRLGIFAIALPLGSYILAEIVSTVICNLMSASCDLNVDNGGSVSVGIMFIIMSIIFKYGAEVKENRHA